MHFYIYFFRGEKYITVTDLLNNALRFFLLSFSLLFSLFSFGFNSVFKTCCLSLERSMCNLLPLFYSPLSYVTGFACMNGIRGIFLLKTLYFF